MHFAALFVVAAAVASGAPSGEHKYADAWMKCIHQAGPSVPMFDENLPDGINERDIGPPDASKNQHKPNSDVQMHSYMTNRGLVDQMGSLLGPFAGMIPGMSNAASGAANGAVDEAEQDAGRAAGTGAAGLNTGLSGLLQTMSQMWTVFRALINVMATSIQAGGGAMGSMGSLMGALGGGFGSLGSMMGPLMSVMGGGASGLSSLLGGGVGRAVTQRLSRELGDPKSSKYSHEFDALNRLLRTPHSNVGHFQESVKKAAPNVVRALKLAVEDGKKAFQKEVQKMPAHKAQKVETALANSAAILHQHHAETPHNDDLITNHLNEGPDAGEKISPTFRAMGWNMLSLLKLLL